MHGSLLVFCCACVGECRYRHSITIVYRAAAATTTTDNNNRVSALLLLRMLYLFFFLFYFTTKTCALFSSVETSSIDFKL